MPQIQPDSISPAVTDEILKSLADFNEDLFKEGYKEIESLLAQLHATIDGYEASLKNYGFKLVQSTELIDSQLVIKLKFDVDEDSLGRQHTEFLRARVSGLLEK